GKGVWGPIPMPPNNVTPEEAKKLATWVLSIK
ncbi:MAG: c-type cytochrome, partial [Rhodocyclaceae bacterium]